MNRKLYLITFIASLNPTGAFAPVYHPNVGGQQLTSTKLSSSLAEHPPLREFSAEPASIAQEDRSSSSSRSAGKHNKKSKHNGGIFSPAVLLAKTVLGEDQLNKVRAKVISTHSDVITRFVETSKTEVGQTVLREMFRYFDVNKTGTIDEQELQTTLQKLGFEWIQGKQAKGILERADTDGNGYLDMSEWMTELPKTLRTNLIKLAKKNGGDLGLLA